MLTDAQDALGHALWDELHGTPAMEIDERDDGYVGTVPVSAYFREVGAWDEASRQAMDFVRGRVLDVGIGAGRHALHLQERGHDVVGIDISPRAVEVSRQRGVEDVRGCAATQVGRHLGAIDTVIMMGNNFGILESRRRAPWLLGRLAAVTGADGRIVAQANDVYATTDPVHLAYHERNRRRGRLAGQIRLRVRYRDYRTPWFDYLMVSPEEMEDLLRGTPWRIREIIDATDSTAYVAILDKRG